MIPNNNDKDLKHQTIHKVLVIRVKKKQKINEEKNSENFIRWKKICLYGSRRRVEKIAGDNENAKK